MAPVVHGLEVEYYNQIDFIYLDIDDNRTDSFKRELGFSYQPHFILLDGQGNILQQWVGVVPASEFSSVFESTFK
jgi:thioredoxin-related protein